MKKSYITTPIYYPSGKFHIGTAYTTLLADVVKRYKTMNEIDVKMLTGMDEHGQKISKKAKERNISEKQHVDEMAKDAIDLWKKIGIDYDYFNRTTNEFHKNHVSDIFDELLKKGDIYLAKYSGYYCIDCESYFTETQLKDKCCPDCNREVSILEEESYFLKLTKYENQLLEYIEQNKDFIKPESRRNEVISFIKSGLQDLSVSRTSFDWGIKVKGNEKHVIYVWIDALSNYITALKGDSEASYKDFFENCDDVIHIVGKDILRFHAIYWPILLMALGIDVKFKLFAHGWILMKDGKMSKSVGNVIYPNDLIERYGVDSIRYYILNSLTYGNDGVFTPENLVTFINTNLANNLGNLVNRTISMANKYFDGTIKYNEDTKVSFDEDLWNTIDESMTHYKMYMVKMDMYQAINSLNVSINRINKYIDETTPWVLAKNENDKKKLENILYNLLEGLRHVIIMLKPFLIENFPKMVEMLGITNIEFLKLKKELHYSYVVTKKPVILFPRLEMEKEIEEIRCLYDKNTSK